MHACVRHAHLARRVVSVEQLHVPRLIRRIARSVATSPREHELAVTSQHLSRPRLYNVKISQVLIGDAAHLDDNLRCVGGDELGINLALRVRLAGSWQEREGAWEEESARGGEHPHAVCARRPDPSCVGSLAKLGQVFSRSAKVP